MWHPNISEVDVIRNCTKKKSSRALGVNSSQRLLQLAWFGQVGRAALDPGKLSDRVSQNVGSRQGSINLKGIPRIYKSFKTMVLWGLLQLCLIYK